MKKRELLEDAKNELSMEARELAIDQIREKVEEIKMAKKALAKMEKRLEELLEEDV